MFRTTLKITAFALMAFLIAAPRATGQTATAAIVGTVRDPSQAVVPNVKIAALRIATGQNFTTISSGTGDYLFSNLPVGEYRLQAEIRGFRTEVKNGVLLEIGRTIRVDFSLGVGEVTQKTFVTQGVGRSSQGAGASRKYRPSRTVLGLQCFSRVTR